MNNHERPLTLDARQWNTAELDQADVPVPPPVGAETASPETANPQGDPIAPPPVVVSMVPQSAQTADRLEETTLWEARYSLKNFIGRVVSRVVATVAWLALAVYAWWFDPSNLTLKTLTAILGGFLAISWLYLGWRVLVARYTHFYRLTNRRLFVSTGIFNRRLDQLELIKVNDVYIRQPSMFHRWFSVGTVVVESSEETYPITYLTGVDHPAEVMDLLWRTARLERDQLAVRIDEV